MQPATLTTPPSWGAELPTVPDVARAVLAAGEDGPNRVPLAEFCRQLRFGHRSTGLRCITRGLKALDGTVVKLPAVRISDRWYTTAAAIEAFVLRLNAPPADAPVPVRSPAERRRASEAADKKLRAAGM